MKTMSHALLLALGLASGGAQALELLVPAYFYPSFDPAQSQWDEMQAALAAGVPVTAIMNPASGPGSASNADYAAAVASFRAAGGRVLGYVYTCYGNSTCTAAVPPTRSVSEVLADAERYAAWYPVDGIFLDEMGGEPASLPFYTQVSQALRAAHPGWRLVGNPGAAVPEASAVLVDTVVTFEQGSGSYASASTAPWMATADPSRQAHLHHSVAGAAPMKALLAEAVRRGAGAVYLTDDVLDNPFDRLPGYWAEEVQAVKALSAVPEPATWALWLGGVAAWGWHRRRPSRG